MPGLLPRQQTWTSEAEYVRLDQTGRCPLVLISARSTSSATTRLKTQSLLVNVLLRVV